MMEMIVFFNSSQSHTDQNRESGDMFTVVCFTAATDASAFCVCCGGALNAAGAGGKGGGICFDLSLA
jgi:hypothetical protein